MSIYFCSFSEELQSLLWPRFKHILNLNVASVREADPSKLGHIDTRPHYVRENNIKREKEKERVTAYNIESNRKTRKAFI